jgi:hypothetical protein
MPKELFKIEGATHIETYWVPEYVAAAIGKLAPFFSRTLPSARHHGTRLGHPSGSSLIVSDFLRLRDR